VYHIGCDIPGMPECATTSGPDADFGQPPIQAPAATLTLAVRSTARCPDVSLVKSRSRFDVRHGRLIPGALSASGSSSIQYG
jgi:hypothetical protein